MCERGFELAAGADTMIDLRYSAPADDVRDIVSIYYHGAAKAPFEGEERAAIAQLRFHLSGRATVRMCTGKSFSISQSTLQGPTTGPTHYELTESSEFVGCGLLPCGWDALLGRSASDYSNEVIALSDQFKTRVCHIEAQLKQANNFEAMISVLDDFARSLKTQVDDNIRKFVSIVDDWLVASPSPDVADLYATSGLSSRQVERVVKYLYGAPPKFIARKFRALRAAQQIKSNGTTAADGAFYDQSHMIRELKHFTGHTPSNLQLNNDMLTQLIDTRAEFSEHIHPLTAIT